ncbi:hypothetical protein AwErysi_06880 [Erysipelotrichaceae bacterium]|nr:hypothetical protein AwErysi_06880 [Erysipelotrichaceae bacterium]
MDIIQQKACIIGRFNFLQQAHKELFIHVMGIANHIDIIIDTRNPDQRPCTILELEQAIGSIFLNIDFQNIQIHTFESEQAAANIMQKIDVNLIYNLTSSPLFPSDSPTICPYSLKKIREIDSKIFDFQKNFSDIAVEFKRYVNKKVVISGIESCGKSIIVKKLASILSTTSSNEVGRFYSDTYLGKRETTFQPKDFVHIVMEQTLQDKKENLLAHKYLLVDTDPIVTLYYLELYQEDMIAFLDKEEYTQAVQFIETLIKNYREKVDIVLYLEPHTPYIADGKRWNANLEKRLILNNRLKSFYQRYDIPLKIIDSISYDDRFNECLAIIKNL